MPTCFKSPDKQMVLYHAVSSYQILEAMLHRLKYHPHESALLLLPDFIVGKYPHYTRLKRKGLFEGVYLFEYLKIQHTNKADVTRKALESLKRALPYTLDSFKEIYVLGAHFYFSLCLINKNIPFIFFEDAAGLYSCSKKLYTPLSKTYPLQAEIAKEQGLFCGKNPLIKKIVLLKRAQTLDVSDKIFCDFDMENELRALDNKTLKKVLSVFVKGKIKAKGDALLLTQNFYGHGIMPRDGQIKLFKDLSQTTLKGQKLVIKPHPDDKLNYKPIFKGARIIKQIFPAELMPYLLSGAPLTLYTFDSSSCYNLSSHYIIKKLRR